MRQLTEHDRAHSRATKTTIARDVAVRVFGNTSTAAVSTAKHYIRVEILDDGSAKVVILNNRGQPAFRFKGVDLVPETVDDLVAAMKDHYAAFFADVDPEAPVSFKLVAALLGASNRELIDMLRRGEGPAHTKSPRRRFFHFKKGDVVAWFAANTERGPEA
jgi:hypothetical protein